MATTRNYRPDLYPDDAYPRNTYAGDTYPADAYAGAVDTWNEQEAAAVDYQPQRRVPEKKKKKSLDEWMEVEFKFGGSRIKRKAVALIVLGAPAALPLFFMLPALFTMNRNTFALSVDDTLGTGAEIALFLCLLVTPLVTLTGQRWFVPLRRWYGIMMGACAIGDALAAGLTDNFAGGFLGRLAGHAFELMGFFMVMLVIPLLITSNHWAQRKLGRYWKRLQQLTYVIWALLCAHLMILEGFKFEHGANGSGFAGDGDPIFHQRLYQYSACSLFLLTLRLPPVKRWISARQKEGRSWLVHLTILPIFALFVFGMIFIINEEIFKGIDSFTEHPSAE
jgi:DMSO/TMAO reductase YedYZ heme-binding membrane subunit